MGERFKDLGLLFLSMKKRWKCPKCKRGFAKENQSHSCRIYPLENHFKNKEHAKELFNVLIEMMRKDVGKFIIDSPECCIHLVRNTTFAAVYALKDRIRLHFVLDYKKKINGAKEPFKMSANRYLYSLDILDKKDINKEILNIIKEAYNRDKE